MAEVLFYHLTRTPLEVTLPELLEKSRARGWKVCVRGGSKERLKWLDDRLWTLGDTSFLPHALADGGVNDANQPILLTTGKDNANAAEILFLVDMATVDAKQAGEYERVCVVFDGSDEDALNHSRGQWKMLTEAGLPAKYWSQEGGNWQQKAGKN